MYAEYLRLRGVEISLRTSPSEALDDLAPLSPSVIVTELAFGRDPQRGCEFIAAARRHPNGQSCVVIVVTGYGRAQDAALARRSGADQFFITPLLPEALELAIEQALDCLRIGQRPPWNGPTSPIDRRQDSRRKSDS
jgi:CheY-like chemotaxis protein